MTTQPCVERIAKDLTERGWLLSTAESCTGGLIGHTLTCLAGSSSWYVGGAVAYANPIKRDLLGVPQEVLDRFGAVSRETVEAMVRGAAGVFKTQTAVAVSGVAGPTGGTPEKPVGTVWMAWLVDGHVSAKCYAFTGDRASIKEQSALAALEGLAERLARR